MTVVRQAGAIAVDLTGPAPRFLVVRGRKNPGAWIFPKGHIESGESAEQAALRELAEEAGVAGRLLTRVGSSRFESGLERVVVAYFLVERTADVPPHEIRERAWLEYGPARRRLSYDSARDLLDTAMRRLEDTHPTPRA